MLNPGSVEQIVQAFAAYASGGDLQVFLSVFDDGSGAIGELTFADRPDVWYRFSNYADLVAKMRELGFELQAPADAVTALGHAQFEISELRKEIGRLRQTIEAMQKPTLTDTVDGGCEQGSR